MNDRDLQWATQKNFNLPRHSDSNMEDDLDPELTKKRIMAKKKLPHLNMLKLKKSSHIKPCWNENLENDVSNAT